MLTPEENNCSFVREMSTPTNASGTAASLNALSDKAFGINRTAPTNSKSLYTTAPDPDKPGMLKKCFNVADPDAKTRKAAQFESRRSQMSFGKQKANTIGGQYRSENICEKSLSYYSNDDLMAVYVNGVMSDSLVPNEATGRVDPSVVIDHISYLRTTGKVKSPPTITTGNSTVVDMDKYIEDDNELYESMQFEYCHYNQRYMYALNQFLILSTSRDAKDNPAAQDMLEMSRKLNIRVNSVLEVMNALAQDRVTRVNSSKGDIDTTNAEIRKRISSVGGMFKRLSRDNVIVTTQREMVRYTQEKNAYTSNQIAVWTALNVAALTAIFFVYRN